MPSPSSTDAGFAPPFDRTSWRLLMRYRRGDAHALTELVSRFLPRLHRWAHGRLPRWARTHADTPDLVHDVMLRTIGRLDALDLQGHDALGAYFRAAVRNRIRDEHRRFARRGGSQPLSATLPDPAPSPLDRTIEIDHHARYRAALARLDSADRELIVGHVELHYSHAQLGCMTGRTPNAARMALQRAIGRLVAQMRDH
jgi:RNA polymerase sigma factor (sigma-70 family)